MKTITAIRHLLKENIITPRQASQMAIRYINSTEREGTTSAKKSNVTERPYICPTCQQEILPF